MPKNVSRILCSTGALLRYGGYMDWENLRSLPIGRGKIDFTRFFEFLIQIGYDGFLTVEATAHNEKGIVDVEMLNEQFRYIRTHFIKDRSAANY